MITNQEGNEIMSTCTSTLQQIFKENVPLTSSVVKQYISTYIQEKEIQDACEKIYEKPYFGYNDNTNEIYFSLNSYCQFEKSLFKLFPESLHLTIHNIFFLYYLHHELYHMVMNSNRFYQENCEQLFFQELTKSEYTYELSLKLNAREFYQNYHDYFLFEYFSIIHGREEVEQIIPLIQPMIPHKIILEYQRFFAGQLLHQYCKHQSDEIICPIEQSDLLFQQFYQFACRKEEQFSQLQSFIQFGEVFDSCDQILRESDYMNDLEKLKLGLPLSNDGYQYLSDIAKGRQKTLHLLEDFKTM